MKRLLAVLAFLGAFLLTPSGACCAVNAMLGVTVSTSSTILGRTPNSAVMGQTLASGSSYLFEENFEAPGYQNSWTESGSGTITPTYATAPAPLQGSYSLRLLGVAQQPTTYSVLSSDQGTLYVYFLCNIASLPGDYFFSLRNSSNVTVLELLVDSTLLRVRNGSSGGASTVTSFSAATTYHIWLKYVKGTGANSTSEVWFSTTGIKPADGSNNYAIKTGGNATTDVNRVYFGLPSNSTWNGIFDRVLCSTSPIGDNP